ncbi:MAG: hypothetical protein V4584_04640 [Verrucomicrobiota bacterium]
MKYLLPLVIASTAISAQAREISFNACPPAVRETIESSLDGGVIDEIDEVQINGLTRYVVDIDGPGGRDVTLRIGPAGKLLLTSEDLKLSECPAAVRTAIKKLLKSGWRIDDIDREVSGKNTRYRIDIDRRNARDLEFVLSRGGKVLERTIERFDP